MATPVALEPDTMEALDAWVSKGRFPSRDLAIRSALYLVQDGDPDEEELTDADHAAIAQGLADIAAGRVRPAEEVFEELLRDLRTKL